MGIAPGHGRADDQLDAEKIKSAFIERTRYYSGVSCELVESVFMTPSYVRAAMGDTGPGRVAFRAGRSKSDDSHAAVPSAKDGFRFQNRWALLVEDGQIRVEDSGRIPDISLGELRDYEHVGVFNGQSHSSLEYASANREYNRCVKKKFNQAKEYLVLKPMFWHCCPADKRMTSIAHENWSVTTSSARLDNVECLVIEVGRLHEMYWLDPSRDYLVLRYQNKSGIHAVNQVDISYEPDDQGGWRPKGWSVRSRTGNRLDSQSEITVTNWVRNPETTESSFQLQLPPGTLVHDSVGDQDRYSIVNRHGDEIAITEDEIHSVPFADLIKIYSDAEGALRGDEGSWGVLTIVAINIGVIVLVIIAFLIRKYRGFRDKNISRSN